MSEMILHHYAMSPYAEKIRLCLGIKDLAWRSVDTPMVLPKPDHFELTGGYRRVPVLQVGADIYCDTACIARELDRRVPEPALYPPGQETIAHSLCQWSETNFMMVVLAFFGIGGVFPEEFVEDRRNTMVPPDSNIDAAPMILGTKLRQIESNLERLEALLSDGRSFVLGETVCVADTAAYHPLMFMSVNERTASLVNARERVSAWMDRMRKLGHGQSEPMLASEAIEIARSSEPEAFQGEPALPDGISIGDPVLVLPDEYGSGNVAGTLAPSGIHEIAIVGRASAVERWSSTSPVKPMASSRPAELRFADLPTMDKVAQQLVSKMMQQFAGSGVSLDRGGRLMLPDGLDVERVHRFAELVLVEEYANPKQAFGELFSAVGVAQKAVSALDLMLGEGGEIDLAAVGAHPIRVGAALPRMLEIPKLFRVFLIDGLSIGDPRCKSLDKAVVSARKGAAKQLGCRAHWDEILEYPDEVGEIAREWREGLC